MENNKNSYNGVNKRIIIPSILFVLALGFSFFVLAQEKEPDGIILFYGDGCPHCAIVDEYLKENNIAEQINFLHKEVYNIPTNAKQLREKARLCGMATDSIGVPFLWDGEKCFVGDQDIINFFKEKITK